MTNSKELHVRAFDLRATASHDGRTIEGIGVPYGVEIEYIPGFFERFEPGSVDDEDAILRYGHAEPLGIIKDRADTDEGRKITALISDTMRGRDIATLIRDGALSKFSIGFYPVEYTDEERDDGLHRIYHKVTAVEYSVVEFPAYADAEITGIRSAPTERTPDMTDSTELRSALSSLHEEVDDMGRELRSQISTLLEARESQPARFEFRSLGEYLHALALASDDRHAQAREAFEGIVTDKVMSRPAWLGVLEKRMTAKQEVTNLFMHTSDLPATGMSVEYAAKKGSSTVAVAEQAAQGDALTSGKPASYEIKSAPVKTYGGAGAISLQAIERASISLLDDLLYEQALEYAKQIETKTRALFSSAVEAAEQSPVHTFASLDQAKVSDWIEFVLKLVDAYDETPYVFDALAVSADVFKALALLPKDPKALQFTGAPDDKQGTISILDGGAVFASIPVKRIPRYTGNHAAGISREAIRIKEAPGAPLRLQDSNILDLTKQFAVYGYATHFAPHPELIKAAKFTA